MHSATNTVAREWRVIVQGRDIGSVMESCEEFARCAALRKFGHHAETLGDQERGGRTDHAIYLDDDFEVSPS